MWKSHSLGWAQILHKLTVCLFSNSLVRFRHILGIRRLQTFTTQWLLIRGILTHAGRFGSFLAVCCSRRLHKLTHCWIQNTVIRNIASCTNKTYITIVNSSFTWLLGYFYRLGVCATGLSADRPFRRWWYAARRVHKSTRQFIDALIFDMRGTRLCATSACDVQKSVSYVLKMLRYFLCLKLIP